MNVSVREDTGFQNPAILHQDVAYTNSRGRTYHLVTVHKLRNAIRCTHTVPIRTHAPTHVRMHRHTHGFARKHTHACNKHSCMHASSLTRTHTCIRTHMHATCSVNVDAYFHTHVHAHAGHKWCSSGLNFDPPPALRTLRNILRSEKTP